MTSVPGSDTLVWSDEQTRFYLQLRIEEKLKDNIRNDVVNVTGRETIITKFHEAFGEKHTWIKFRNKFNTCKKQYKSLKKLTHNRTRLGYHSNGSIHMTDDWWNDRCKKWPGAKKFKDKPVANTDLMEQIFSSVHISGAEGWSAQQGENHLDNMFLEDDDAASESRQNFFNRRHSSLRSVIERTFGVWKAKWRILDRKHPKYELKKWVKIVTATMALHNFIRDSHYEDRDFAHWEAVDEYEHHGDQVVEHGEEVNIEHIPYVPTGDRSMEILRDVITEKIERGRQLPY